MARAGTAFELVLYRRSDQEALIKARDKVPASIIITSTWLPHHYFLMYLHCEASRLSGIVRDLQAGDPGLDPRLG